MVGYGWAYGSKGKGVEGKELVVGVWVGGGEDGYEGGGCKDF